MMSQEDSVTGAGKFFYAKRIGFLLFVLALVAGLPLVLSAVYVATAANVTRGPYLQTASQNGITIIWNTNQVFDCKLRYGQTPGVLDSEVVTSAGTLHAVQITDLQPDTRYFYEIEVDGCVVFTGSDYWFRTYPPVSSERPFAFLAWGDSGTGGGQQAAVATQMDSLLPRPEFALGIGDLVYPAGEPANYNPRFFTPYRNLIRNMVIWPAMGNHDAATAGGQPYLDAFYCPTASGASSNPSNTELYYSFDYGSSHFVCLDSQVTYDSGTSARSTMLQWLVDDLDAANARGARWKFVYFHHPPYTKGTHDSDAESQLIWLRTNLNPAMEARGVDMVLTGHSHVYERSFLLKNDAVLQGSASDYTKIATPDGCIYIVTGCGGQVGSGALNHPLMAFSKGNIAGNSVIDVSADVCRGYYIQSDGVRIDLFSLSKAPDTASPFVRSIAPEANGVDVVFSEPLQGGAGAGSAENVANYAISGGVSVNTAVLLSDKRTVRLGTSTHNPATGYTLTINNVSDLATSPNQVMANTQIVYTVGGSTGANQPPVSVFATDVSALNSGGTVNFDGTYSFDPDGTLSAYLWSFGDGATSTSGYCSTHTYSVPGIYLAALTVTDNFGAQSVSRRLIYVHSVGNLPIASASASSTTVSPGASVTFSSVGSSDPDGGNVWTHWDFGDPGSGSNHSSLGSPVHVFTNTGFYTVKLTVTDDEGSQATAFISLTVGTPAAVPSIDTSVLPDATVGQPYSLKLSASGGSVPYMWSLASGAVPSGLAFGSNGVLAGTPTVEGPAAFTVSVMDGAAQTDAKTLTMNVQPAPTKGNNDEGCSTREDGGVWVVLLAVVVAVFASRQCRTTKRPA